MREKNLTTIKSREPQKSVISAAFWTGASELRLERCALRLRNRRAARGVRVCGREQDSERGTAPDALALRVDTAAVELYQMTNDRETQAEAAARIGA